jgi:hypothetical protein
VNEYSKKATWEVVKDREDLIVYHSDRFIAGHRDEIARTCFQYLEQRKQDNA